MKIGILPSTFTRGITAASRYIMHRCVLGVFTIKPIGEPGAITFKSLEPKPAMATGRLAPAMATGEVVLVRPGSRQSRGS